MSTAGALLDTPLAASLDCGHEAMAHTDGEEQLVVCAEATQSEAVAIAEQIQQAVAAQIGLSVYKVEIVPQGGLPRTSSGKPQRRKTKQMFLEGTLPKPRSKAED